MAGKRKRCARSFPTFCEGNPAVVPANAKRTPGPITPAFVGAEAVSHCAPMRGRGVEGRSLLQLTLQRFDLFGKRGILGNQGLDFAHGV